MYSKILKTKTKASQILNVNGLRCFACDGTSNTECNDGFGGNYNYLSTCASGQTSCQVMDFTLCFIIYSLVTLFKTSKSTRFNFSYQLIYISVFVWHVKKGKCLRLPPTWF